MAIKVAALAFCLSAAAAVAAAQPAPGTPAATAGPDWARVLRLKPGADLIVDTGLYPIGPQAGERCRLLAVDASTLTCKTRGWRRKRLVFPAAAVSSVYHVHHVLTLGDYITLTGVALLLGGAIASSAGPFLAGAVVLIVVGAHAAADATRDAFSSALGQPPSIPSNERDDLIYLRATQPPAAPTGLFGASMP